MKQKNHYERPEIEVINISIEMACMSTASVAAPDYEVDVYSAEWE